MRAIDFLVEYQQLDEVNMSPSSLKLLVKSINATAGMEFEMIVPNTQSPEDSEYEPDYDADDRASSWSGIEDFFMGGDGNNSRRDVRSMIESMQEQFFEWLNEKRDEDWNYNGESFLREYIELNDYFDEDAAIEVAKDELAENNPEIEEDSEEYNKYIRERVEQEFDAFVEDEWSRQGRIYDRAYESFMEDWDSDNNIDEGDWLDSNYKWMTDVYREFGVENDVYWPHTMQVGGSEDIENVAESFSDAIGRPCNASNEYHGVRKAREYTVEPDGSLQPDSDDDTGLEFVSPPLPLTELVADLKDVIDWANSYGCYTNESTGLHMNVSVPNYSLKNVDYTKLALLLGDEYILKQFSREANNYCRSAISRIRKNVAGRPEDVARMLDKMRSGLDEQAIKLIHTGVTDKYTSINTKDGYIEFRSPGGDWLNEDVDTLTNTLYRFVVAMDAACDPQKYKEDYYKKLYKLLNPDNSTDAYGRMVQDFSQYVTAVGGAPQKVVADFRRVALATLKQAQGKETGDWWWNVSLNGQRIEVVGKNKQEAWEDALRHNREWGNYSINDAKIEMLRPFNNKPAPQGEFRARADAPQPVGRRPAGPTLNGRPSNPDGNYVIVDSNNDGTPVYRFMASGLGDATTVLRQWEDANPGTEWANRFDPNQSLGQPGQSAAGASQPIGQQDYVGIRNTQTREFVRDNSGNVIRLSSPMAAYNYMATNNFPRNEYRISDLNMVDASELAPRTM
jgi:hypothetical protein